MGKKIKLQQAKATKLAAGEVLTGIYEGQRKQTTRFGERTLHSFKDAKSGEVTEVWGTTLLDRSSDLAAAVGKPVSITKLNEGDRGAAVEYDIEIG